MLPKNYYSRTYFERLFTGKSLTLYKIYPTGGKK